jgi:hypothetical protein
VVDFTLKGKQKVTVGRILLQASTKHLGCREASNTIKKFVAELINKHFPDFRRVLNECQRYSTSGTIDAGVLALSLMYL